MGFADSIAKVIAQALSTDDNDIVYDPAAMRNIIDSVGTAASAVKKADDSISDALKFIVDNPEAGGALTILGSGKTVQSIISASAKTVYDSETRLKESKASYESANEDLGKGFGDVLSDVISEVIPEVGTAKKLLNTGSGAIDAWGNGDSDLFLEKLFGFGGTIAAVATGQSWVSNAGDFFREARKAEKMGMEVANSATDSYYNGEIGVGEMIGRALGSGTGAAIAGLWVDGPLNMFGIDIPDSAVQWYIDKQADIWGTTGKIAETAVNQFGYILEKGWDFVSSLF